MTNPVPDGSPAKPDESQAESIQSPSSPSEATARAGVAAVSLAGFRDVFRSRPFVLLFTGQAISALGDWVGTLAFIAAAHELSGGRAEAIAGVLILRLLPSFFATPIGGVLSDRLDRKKLMVWTDIARFAVIGLVPFVPSLGALYAFAFAHECFSLVNLPARDASVPNVVDRDRLEAANALLMGSSFAAIPLSGPVFALLALAGTHFPRWAPGAFVFREHPWAFAFIFDALTFLVSAAFIQRMHLPRRLTDARPPDERVLTAARAGARYVLDRPFLRGLAFAVSVGMLGGGVLFALGIKYVEETLNGGNVEFGWLMGLFGIGMLAGFVVSQAKPEGGVAWMVRISLVTMGGVLITMAILPFLWLAYVSAIGFGASFSVSLIVAMSAVQARADDEHRGRVMGAVHMLVRAALSFGALGAAALAGAVPARIRLPGTSFRPDRNQFALIVAGSLIALGSTGVRGDSDATDPRAG